MNTKFEIEKGFLPPKRSSGPQAIWPFEEMEISDSFKIEIKEGETIRLVIGRVHAGISYFRKHYHSDWIFTVRTIDNYVRCWRIK